jgi:hypothetical protein
VEEVVVPAANEHEVVEGGGTPAGDPADMVGFGPVGRSIAAGIAAVAVADDQGVEQGSGDGAGGGAVVQDGGAAVADDPVDAGVAGQAPQGDGVEDAAVDQRAGRPAFEVAEGRDDVEVGAVTAPAAGLLVVEEPPAHIHEGVGASLGGATARFALNVARLSQAEGGGDDSTAFGVEAAGELAASVKDSGQVQRPFRHGRFGEVAHHGVGAPGPVLHGDRGVCNRQRGELGHQVGLMVGEHVDGAVLEVGGDGLDLPARQHPSW